jgi:hypothetical protein
MATIEEFITSEYKKLKSLSMRIWYNMKNGDFNEDVFHDTLVRCMESLKEKELEHNEYLMYFASSFKRNSIRNTKYACNKNKEDIDINTHDIPHTYYDTMDYDWMMSKLEVEFGKDNMLIFNDWIDGNTVNELNEKHSRTNCRYLIDKMRQYAKRELVEK